MRFKSPTNGIQTNALYWLFQRRPAGAQTIRISSCTFILSIARFTPGPGQVAFYPKIVAWTAFQAERDILI